MKAVLHILFWLICIHSFAQNIYVTSSGGSFTSEKWISITTGPNGSGVLVWGQGDGTYGNGQGLVNDEVVDISAFCGQTLFINAYDRYDDSWDGTTYEIWDGPSQTGNLLASNGGSTPDSFEDDDCSGSSWCISDPSSELEISEAFAAPSCPCNNPAASYTVIPDCANAEFSIQVDLSSTGDASGVDISDGTTIYQSNVVSGVYTVGPFLAGSNQVIDVIGSLYGGCDISSTALTEDCICANPPSAVVNAVNLDCSAFDYDIEVTVSDYGDGTSADILIDGAVVQVNALLTNTYTFSGYSTGTHSISIEASGGAFVSCESSYTTNLTCNGADNFSLSAPDITNSCSSGDLSSASVGTATGFTVFCDAGGVGSGDVANNVIRECPAGFNNNTDYVDLWYQVDLPDGGDEMTLSVTGLGAGEILGFVLHTSDPGVNASSNVASVDGNFECSFFDQTVTSHTITGLAGESTAPLYIRILGIAVNDGDCSTIATPSFSICTSIPQPNDLCGDAIDIDGISTSGNLCAANIDTENSETGATCADPAEANDLWYSVTMDAADPDQNLEVDLTFSGAADEVVVELYSNCFSNTFLECSTISSTGLGSTVTHRFNSTISAGGFGPTWYVRVIPASGNSVCDFEIEGRRIAENNDCSLFQNVFPGFDITSAQTLDYNFATESGANPVVAGNDLWYAFDPVSGTDNGLNVYSTSAEINVSGLAAGEELTVLLYEGSTVSSDNCTNLNDNYLSSINISSNGSFTFNCLNETQSSADGGYLVRIIQTAGGTIATPSVTVTPSAQVGKYNNSCVNIWDGNSPSNLGVSDAAHQFNAFYILDGETVTGDFSGTTDCDDEITSSVCSGVSNDPFDEANQRDLWYIIRVPDVNCTSLTTSTVVNSIDLTYDASNSARDAKIYIYSDCGDGDLLACSPSLDGAGETWEVGGLTQGEYYLVRVKPNSINSDFDYSFELTVNNGAVRPCNNEGVDAQGLTVESCNDYNNLDVYSMRGADPSPGTSVPENDVWFSFIAPNPANGGGYFIADRSWVTVFLENVSGTATGPLSMELYSSPNASIASASTYSTTSAAGSQAFGQFGHLIPGQTYYLRVYHKESETATVNYNLNVYTPNVNETDWTCGRNSTSVVSGCSEGCNDLREAYFKIDLPEGLPSNYYYLIEVVGEDQILDFELRSQFLSESSAAEGDFDDYDLPCSSRPVEPGVSMISETLNITSPLTGESCDMNGDSSDGGSGVRRIYFGLNGPASGMKDYYYIRVFMDPSDPNFATSTGLNICAINFNGPYSTEALASAGGSTDIDCSPSLDVDLISFEGAAFDDYNELSWGTLSETNNSHFAVEHSSDGNSFELIGMVKGNGTSSDFHAYNFRHKALSSDNYYRLRQVDFDGTETISNTIYLQSKTPNIEIIPNPIASGDEFLIAFHQMIDEIYIYDTRGVLVLSNSNLFENSLEVTKSFKPGVYIISARIGNQNLMKKLVVN